MRDAPTTVLDRIDDRPTTILPALGALPTSGTAEAEAQRVLRQQQAPSLPLLHRVLDGLRALTVRRCAHCGTEPVVRPDHPAVTVDGRFCVDCIDHCLTDTDPGHWCPIDELTQ